MNYKPLALLSALLATTAGLEGCSNGSSNHSTTTSTTTSSTLSGSAVKGLMSFAPVSVFPITDGAVGETALATGQTDVNGHYQITLENYSGPVQVQLSVGDGTLMICDTVSSCGTYDADDELDLDADLTIDFGDKFRPTDTSLILNALVPTVQAGATIPVQITPLTHAAAAFAQSDGANLDAEAITRANLQLASVLGLTIDIVNTPPVDVTAIPEQSTDGAIEYAALLAALASMAAEQEISDSEMISLFADAFIANGGQLIQNSASEETFTLQDLYAASSEALTAASNTSATDLASVQAELAQNELSAGNAMTDSLTSVELPEDVSTLNALAAAKSLVSDVRTWGHVIEQDAEGPIQELEDHVLAIEDSLDAAVENLHLKQGMENLFGAEDESEEGQVSPLLDMLEYALDITSAVLAEEETATSYDLSETIPGLDSSVFEGQDISSTGTVSVDRINHKVDIVGVINGQTADLHFESSDLESESTTEVFVRISENQTSRVENESTYLNLSGGASVSTNVAVNLDDDIEEESIEMGLLSAEVTIGEKTGTHPSTFTGTLASVISRDLASLGSAVATLPLTGISNLDQFPGIPTEIQTDLHTQHFFRVTGTAEGTEESLDGTLFWAISANEASTTEGATEEESEEESEPDVHYQGFEFIGELSNGLGDRLSGGFEFTYQKALEDRHNVTSVVYTGAISTQGGDSFDGIYSLNLESPTLSDGDNAGEVATDEYGDELLNLAHITLSGEFHFSTGESLLASVVANSDNADTFIPEPGDSEEETEDNYRDVDLALSYSAQLTGLPLARFTLTGERTGFEDGIANLDISYGGSLSDAGNFSGSARRIQVQLDSTAELDDLGSNHLSISNEEGVTITLGVTCEEGDSQTVCEDKLNQEGTRGAITVGDEKVADLDLVDDNWLIRYIDGTFESLF